MRSTLTIDDDTDRILRQLAAREGFSYKEAVNLALEKGLEQLVVTEAAPRYRVEPFDAGFAPGIDPMAMNRLADTPDE